MLTAANGQEGLRALQDHDIDVVVLDIEMPVMDGLEMLEEMSKLAIDDVPVIVYTARGSFQRCVRAVQLGAFNFFDKDEVTLDQLNQSIQNALETRRLKIENRELRRVAKQDSPIIGTSSATKALCSQIVKIAAVPSNVLIQGESGTGKELVARELHRLSSRSGKAFVAVNCAAIPENLVESELFGFERGAFSGAAKTTKGKFELAHGGTLFLDEIGDLPLPAQAKLLRVLQEGELTRLGGENRMIKTDARVVAATHRNIEDQIASRMFRQDLYFRICTHILQVPPLRDRLDDVRPLTLFFVERICERFGIPRKKIATETLLALRQYDWHRNNVRELENIVERMIIQCSGDELRPEHLPADITSSGTATTYSAEKTLVELKEEAERNILLHALENHDWHITNTAKTLGVANHSNLLKMMRRLGIRKPEA
jgi:DNA-binding NtrC family response regulator